MQPTVFKVSAFLLLIATVAHFFFLPLITTPHTTTTTTTTNINITTMSQARKVFVVTGGCRGIGAEVVKQLSSFASGPTAIVATSRKLETAEAFVKTLTPKDNVEIIPLAVDTGDKKSVTAFSSAIKEKFGHIFSLINNAGVMETEWNQKNFKFVSNVNTFGPLQLSRELLSSISEGGNIINVSSGLGEWTSQPEEARRILATSPKGDIPTLDFDSISKEKWNFDFFDKAYTGAGYAPYRVSKVTLNIITRSLQEKLNEEGRDIAVVSICPGWCASDMGGANATRTPAKGAETISWSATVDGKEREAIKGEFLRDKKKIAW